jgi:uncharacterized protein YukE
VPTPESAAAFAKLVEARTLLNEISGQLREALEKRGSGPASEQRFREVQARWDEALRTLQQLTDEFSALIQDIPDDNKDHQT